MFPVIKGRLIVCSRRPETLKTILINGKTPLVAKEPCRVNCVIVRVATSSRHKGKWAGLVRPLAAILLTQHLWAWLPEQREQLTMEADNKGTLTKGSRHQRDAEQKKRTTKETKGSERRSEFGDEIPCLLMVK